MKKTLAFVAAVSGFVCFAASAVLSVIWMVELWKRTAEYRRGLADGCRSAVGRFSDMFGGELSDLDRQTDLSRENKEA